MMPTLTHSSKGTDLRTAVVAALGFGIVVAAAAVWSKADGKDAAEAGLRAKPVTLSAKAPEIIRTGPIGTNIVVENRDDSRVVR